MEFIRSQVSLNQPVLTSEMSRNVIYSVVTVLTCLTLSFARVNQNAVNFKIHQQCYELFDKLIQKANVQRKIKLVQTQFRVCDSSPQNFHKFLQNLTQKADLEVQASENFHVKVPFLPNHQLQHTESSYHTKEHGNGVSEHTMEESLLPREATIVFLVVFVPIYFSVLLVATVYFIYILGATSQLESKNHKPSLTESDHKEAMVQHIHLHINKHKSESEKHSMQNSKEEEKHGAHEPFEEESEEKEVKVRSNFASTKTQKKLKEADPPGGRFKKETKPTPRRNPALNRGQSGSVTDIELAGETIGLISESVHLAGYKLLLANVLMHIYEEEVLRRNAGGAHATKDNTIVSLLNKLNSTTSYAIPDLSTWNSSSFTNNFNFSQLNITQLVDGLELLKQSNQKI